MICAIKNSRHDQKVINEEARKRMADHQKEEREYKWSKNETLRNAKFNTFERTPQLNLTCSNLPDK